MIGDRFHAINSAVDESDDPSYTDLEPSISKYFEYSISEGKRQIEKELESEKTNVSSNCLRKDKFRVIISIFSIHLETAGSTAF